MPCTTVSSYSSDSISTLGNMWDEIVLTDDEPEVLKALHIIDPNITDISMLGSGPWAHSPTFFVRVRNGPGEFRYNLLGKA